MQGRVVLCVLAVAALSICDAQSARAANVSAEAGSDSGAAPTAAPGNGTVSPAGDELEEDKPITPAAPAPAPTTVASAVAPLAKGNATKKKDKPDPFAPAPAPKPQSSKIPDGGAESITPDNSTELEAAAKEEEAKVEADEGSKGPGDVTIGML